MDEMMFAVGLGIGVLTVYLLAIAITVASYILTSLSLYTLAKRRGVQHPGLAWVPVANYWLIGSLANEIDAQNGHQRTWNKTLLTLSLTAIAGVVVSYISIIVIAVVYTFSLNYIDWSEDVFLSLLLVFYVLLVLAMIVAVALSICTAICIYKIFESTVPEKAVKYLLLYILVPLAGGICLFKARNQGYPYPALPAEAE